MKHEADVTSKVLCSWQPSGSNTAFEALFSDAPIMLHVLDKHGRYLRVSKYLADRLGYTVEDMVGQHMVDFLTPDSRAYAEQSTIPEILNSDQTGPIEVDILCKDGQILPLIVSAIAQYDEGATFDFSLVVSFDNSAARKIEQNLLEPSKNDSIGDVVGGVAHDVNNLLAVVQGNLEFLARSPGNPAQDVLFKDAFEATKRGAVMIDQLLTHGRKTTPLIKGIDVHDVALSACRLVRRLLPSNVEIQVVPNETLWRAHADAALLETAILNILDNACDAMPSGGKIRIETSNFEIEEEVADVNLGLPLGHYVRISVSDTGTGIDPAHLPTLFEPFFTTKSDKGGSGLGLAMVMGFAEQSRGTIQVKSEPGTGSTFSMYLPVHSAGVASQVADQQRHGQKVLLIVEDDSNLRSVLLRQLKDHSIKIVEAETGDAAFKAICDGLKPDLLLTDMAMPGDLQGPDLVQKARAILPKLRVVFISGLPHETANPADVTRSSDVHLTKPVSQDRLRAAVMDLLMKT